MSGGLRYVGGGFFAGVPARDLTAEEADRFGREMLLRSLLYIEIDVADASGKDKPRPAENKLAAGPQENKDEV